jgi:hypothetical protein
MANSNNNTTTVQWSASSSVSLTSNTTRQASDAVSINADAVQASIRVKADNAGTPASGDTVDVWVSWSADGTNYDTEEHAQFLGRLDTYGTNDPGEDPAAKVFTLNVSGKQKFKLLTRGNQAASRNVTITAEYNEHRMA